MRSAGRSVARRAGLGLLSVVVLAGCASAAAPTRLAPPIVQTGHGTPAQSRDDEPGGLAGAAARNPLDNLRSGLVRVQAPTPALRPTPSETVRGPALITGVNPCTLVSVTAAQAITGGAVSGESEAPLGPTCIYAVAHAPPITVAITSATLRSAARALHQRRQLSVSGRPAYCGTMGRPMLYVAAGTGSVLNVVAPCPLAQKLASRALASLSR